MKKYKVILTESEMRKLNEFKRPNIDREITNSKGTTRAEYNIIVNKVKAALLNNDYISDRATDVDTLVKLRRDADDLYPATIEVDFDSDLSTKEIKKMVEISDEIFEDVVEKLNFKLSAIQPAMYPFFGTVQRMLKTMQERGRFDIYFK